MARSSSPLRTPAATATWRCSTSSAFVRWTAHDPEKREPVFGSDHAPKSIVMDPRAITAGRNPPKDINVIIEIPLGGAPIKYELDKTSGALSVDRFLHTAMFYPGNYGFIPQTLSQDGDPCDVLVIAPVAVVPGAVIRCRPVGALLMEDQAGTDEKIIAVPVDALDPFYKGIHST